MGDKRTHARLQTLQELYKGVHVLLHRLRALLFAVAFGAGLSGAVFLSAQPAAADGIFHRTCVHYQEPNSFLWWHWTDDWWSCSDTLIG